MLLVNNNPEVEQEMYFIKATCSSLDIFSVHLSFVVNEIKTSKLRVFKIEFTMTCMCLVSQYRENAREKQIEKNEYVWLGLVYLVDYNVANSRYLATGTLKGDNQRL